MDKLHKQCRCKIRLARVRSAASKASASMAKARATRAARSATWSRFRVWTCRCTTSRCKWSGRVLWAWVCLKGRYRCQISSRWCSQECRPSETTDSKWGTRCHSWTSHRRDRGQETQDSAHSSPKSKITDNHRAQNIQSKPDHWAFLLVSIDNSKIR